MLGLEESIPYFARLGDREKGLFLATLICSSLILLSLIWCTTSLFLWTCGRFVFSTLGLVAKDAQRRISNRKSRTVRVSKVGGFLVDDGDDDSFYFDDGEELTLVDTDGKKLRRPADEDPLLARHRDDDVHGAGFAAGPAIDEDDGAVTEECERYAKLISIENDWAQLNWAERLTWVSLNASVWAVGVSVTLQAVSLSMFDLVPVELGMAVGCCIMVAVFYATYPPSVLHVMNKFHAPSEVRVQRSAMQELIHRIDHQGRDGPIRFRLRWLWKRQVLFKLAMRGRPKRFGGGARAPPDQRRCSMIKLAMLYVGCAAVVFATLFAFGSTWGTCVCTHPAEFSTRFSRSFTSDVCTGTTQPCHLYLTMTEHTATQMIVNFHTAMGGGRATVYFDTVSHASNTTNNHSAPPNSSALDAYAFSSTGKTQYLDFLANDVDRFVHFVQLSGLQPNTTYYFRAGLGGNHHHHHHHHRYTSEHSFRTLPATGRVHFAAGGDMGTSGDAEAFFRLAGALDVDFMLIGGDLAYAGATPACYRRWDQWLRQWRANMRGAHHRLIPIIAALGNHEGQEMGPVGIEPGFTPFFSSYFPQRSDSPAHWHHRKTYSKHAVSNHSLILALDSGHGVAANNPRQMAFLNDSLESAANASFRFATYHVPLYPTGREADNAQTSTSKAAWLPSFDQYRLTMGFENHDHTYKRTYPLRNNSINNDSGTIYIGDGCMGVAPRPSHPAWYSQVAISSAYMLHVDVTTSEVNVNTLSINGSVFDHVSVQRRGGERP